MVNEHLKDLIIDLYKTKDRIDNRKKYDGYRDISIEYDISKNAEGSARVKIGKTDVAVGVKLDLGEPYPDRPDAGTIIVNAEFAPIASPDFEPGPPRSKAVELARVVDRGIRESGMVDFKKLCVKKGEHVWLVFIDIYIMNHDGNLIDASALAAVAALTRAVYPKIDKNNKVLYGEKSKKKLKIERVPITTTFARIDSIDVIDPNLEEEEAMDARLSVATDGKTIYAMQKGGFAAFKPSEIDSIVVRAFAAAKEIKKLLKTR